jgi:hypothetical protein
MPMVEPDYLVVGVSLFPKQPVCFIEDFSVHLELFRQLADHPGVNVIKNFTFLLQLVASLFSLV